jgi:hypothetical protein
MAPPNSVKNKPERCVSFETLQRGNPCAQSMAEHCDENAVYLTESKKVARFRMGALADPFSDAWPRWLALLEWLKKR